MQSASSRIWTRVAVSISYDDNHYTVSHLFTLSLNVKVNSLNVKQFYLTHR